MIPPLRLLAPISIVAALTFAFAGCDRAVEAVQTIRQKLESPRENVDAGEKDAAAALRPVTDPQWEEMRRYRESVAAAFAEQRFD